MSEVPLYLVSGSRFRVSDFGLRVSDLASAREAAFVTANAQQMARYHGY